MRNGVHIDDHYRWIFIRALAIYSPRWKLCDSSFAASKIGFFLGGSHGCHSTQYRSMALDALCRRLNIEVNYSSSSMEPIVFRMPVPRGSVFHTKLHLDGRFLTIGEALCATRLAGTDCNRTRREGCPMHDDSKRRSAGGLCMPTKRMTL